MRDTFRQSMAWLHTWAGLVAGWMLFVIFFAGTLACFDKELDYWMRPALHHRTASAVSMDAAAASMRALAPHAETLYLRPPTARDPSIHGLAFEPGKPYVDVAFKPEDGQPIPDTVGGTFFFTLHYNLMAGDAGIYLVGLAGMLMLLALISGVIIHRRLFKDFFVFRPTAGAQRAWLDGHNLSAVLGLPFHLMIAYTGVAIMVSSYMFAGVQIAYHGDTSRYYDELQGTPQIAELHRPPSRIASLDPILADAVRRMHGPALYMELDRIHDTSFTVSVSEAGNDQVAGGRRNLRYNGESGAFEGEDPPPESAYRVYQFLSGLHRAQYGGAAIRWLYFLLGATGCVMLACGLHVWVVKRIRRAEEAGLCSGYGLVRTLNPGVVAGLPLASVALLWIDRLLPLQLLDRADWEARGFAITWGLAALYAAIRLSKGQPWRKLFAITSILLIGLPLLDGVIRPQSSLLHSLRDHDSVLATVDLSAFALGGIFAWLAKKGSKSRASSADQKQPRRLGKALTHEAAP